MASNEESSSSSATPDWNAQWSNLQRQVAGVHDTIRRWRGPLFAVFLALAYRYPTHILHYLFLPFYRSVLTLLGIALGLGLGLGLATHVYDQLEHWTQRDAQAEADATRNGTDRAMPPAPLASPTGLRHRSSLHKASLSSLMVGLEDEQTYAALMTAAGYYPVPNVLRGQVLRVRGPNQEAHSKNTAPDQTVSRYHYQFDRGTVAVDFMNDLWPTLPTAINQQLGLFVEFIVRDFVASWYHKMDTGCVYPVSAKTHDTPTSGDHGTSKDAPVVPSRRLVTNLGPFQKLPFLEHLYESMAIVFGNLATRVEHVNIMEVVLLKWIRVLAHTFKVYRALRKSVHNKRLSHLAVVATSQDGNNNNNNYPSSATGTNHVKTASTAAVSSTTPGPLRQRRASAVSLQQQRNATPVSEMAMTKEFLFCGKLHKAVTFGLDVPALLFADASGKECGDGRDVKHSSSLPQGNKDHTVEEDAVLERRLFDTRLLEECELDYNRVVGHRMVRALLPRHDFGSTIVQSLVTEIMAGCVLSPIMGCLSPDYINGWLVSGLSKAKPDEGTEDNDTVEESEKPVNTAAEEPEKRGWDLGSDAAAADISEFDDSIRSVSRSETMSNSMWSIDGAPDPQENEFQGKDLLSGNDSPLHSPTMKAPEGTPTRNQMTDTRGLTPVREQSQGPLRASASLEKMLDTGISNDKNDTDIVTELAMALIDMQQHMDFDEIRQARVNQQELQKVPWDDSACQASVIRMVLVIEAALTHGRCAYRVDETDNGGHCEDVEGLDDSSRPVEDPLPNYEPATLSQILMEMTSDIEAFEERVAIENTLSAASHSSEKYKDTLAIPYKPSPTEQSTLRTLIAAWLHTGQIYRTITVLVQAHATVLIPYYHSQAFLRSAANAAGFVRQLKSLKGVDILVDTMTVLASPRLDELGGDELAVLVKRSQASPDTGSSRPSHTLTVAPSATSTMVASQYMGPTTTPRHVDFHRNEAFAASLRSERERRTQSWCSLFQNDDEDGVPIICRSRGTTEKDEESHRELHHISRIFYTSTNLAVIRDAARRKASNDFESMSQSEASENSSSVPVSLLTVETASPRRRIEVPDDDSSFLLRAQPRPLNAVGVHRDQRNHDQSFKCFAATYEEPVAPKSGHYTGGRYIRRCLVRYYPIDRTACIALQNDNRKLDQRKTRGTVPDTITVGQPARPTPFLSTEFLRERHLCQRWAPKGTNRSQSILTTSVMEPTDFTAMPRSGKATDFIYRMTLFEKPMIALGVKHFIVHDSASLGTHRADASALEMSDAALSATLMAIGAENGSSGPDYSGLHHEVEMGKDGYPIVWMKFSRSQDDTQVEVKPYRVSFVRAALMVTSARHEAQLQSLIKCVREGSAKKATKALTDARLRPTLRLLEYAGNKSREKQSILLRDLKLGVNHIDRMQLRRNGLLLPRYPTRLLDLTAVIEDALDASEVRNVELYGTMGVVYKIRCTATIDLLTDEVSFNDRDGYKTSDGTMGRIFKEDWVVYRSFKEFQIFHKHLKNQVSALESSGTAGSRLVVAASAAFTTSASATFSRHRQRKVLIPSMSQATKVGALGITKKSILKRKECLHEYLENILSPGHLLSRCPELLLFLGAFYPLLPEVRIGQIVSGIMDPLGRTAMTRAIVEREPDSTITETIEAKAGKLEIPGKALPTRNRSRTASHGTIDEADDDDDFFEEGETLDGSSRKSRGNIEMIPAVRNKVDKVPLAQVRSRIFELLRYQFGFENASFVRNRMLAAIKTASLAVTSASEFRRTLYNLHVTHVNSESLAGWIKFTSDLLWPEGVFFQSKPPLTEEERDTQACKSRNALHESFPEALRAVLGQELTHDGLDIFHEMLQNRIVVKSMAYMLFDLLWIEVFPEIGDVLQCGAALDIED